MRNATKFFYFTVLVVLTATSIKALTESCYIIGGAVIGVIAVVSILTSLIPYFISQSMFRKYEANPDEKKHLKIWGLIIYLFCFPVKLWVIYVNIEMLKEGCGGWNFG